MTQNNYLIYGKYPSLAAISNNKRRIIEIFCTEKIYNNYLKLINLHNYKIVDNNYLQHLILPQNNHQGIVIKVEPIVIHNLKQIQHSIKKVVILDQITDPHNVGAIIRSAVSFNFDTIILPKHNTPEENSTIAKTASGSLEYINFVKAPNINRTILELKKLDFWVIGLDVQDSNIAIDQVPKYHKIALVLGSEGEGLRNLVQKNCDGLVRIPISKHQYSNSLNVSNAAAIAFCYLN